jgi:hypothetical protein
VAAKALDAAKNESADVAARVQVKRVMVIPPIFITAKGSPRMRPTLLDRTHLAFVAKANELKANFYERARENGMRRSKI